MSRPLRRHPLPKTPNLLAINRFDVSLPAAHKSATLARCILRRRDRAIWVMDRRPPDADSTRGSR